MRKLFSTKIQVSLSTLIFSIFLSIFCPLVSDVQGQILKPVKWSFSKEKISDTEFNLVFKASIDAGWTVYSLYTADNGPVPTTITYEKKDGASLAGKAVETGHKKEGPDALFDNVNVIKYLDDQDFVIKQRVKVTDKTKPINGYLNFMTCNNVRCLTPEDVDFSFSFADDIKAAAPTTTAAAPTTKVEKAPTAVATTTTTTKSATTAVATKKTTEVNTAPIAMPTPATTTPASSGLESTPVHWTIERRHIEGNTYELVYTANIDNGWNVYSQFTSAEGPVPTSITYEKKEGITLLGTSTETGKKKEGFDKIFNVNVIKFLSGEPYVIKQKITVADSTKPISGYLTYMCCDSEKCLPPTDVNFDLSFGQANAVATTDGGPNISGEFIDQLIPSIYNTNLKPDLPCNTKSEQKKGHFWTFFFGFIGGLFALLTPCVFPMLPITVSFFSKDTKRPGWLDGLIYGLSIIAIYVTLGLMITIFFGPEALNRLSTSWIANTIFFIIFIVFALSFFGFYEITLPSSWTTKSDKMADKGGLLGIFFMAFTLALVSFSCTGPIIGTALVSASSKGEVLGPFLVMFGFSLALALPFGLFATFPSWLNNLPRSGSWMNSVKVVLGFLELALAFKFLSVADLTSHWGFLRYELFLGLWILIFGAMALYLWGLLKFKHDSPIKKLSPMRMAFASLISIFTLYLATGFMYNDTAKSYQSLSALSGIAPPTHYNFLLQKAEVDPAIKAKYPSFTKCANNIPCFKDYYEGLAYARENKKPMFIDFTGHGCVNCRKTEELIWVDDRVRNQLINDFVLISLYVDDDKKLETTLVSKTRNVKIRNVGNMWADFQILNFQQNSQPLYIIMDAESQNVLTKPRGFENGIEGYLTYMDCGKNEFKQLGGGQN